MCQNKGQHRSDLRKNDHQRLDKSKRSTKDFLIQSQKGYVNTIHLWVAVEFLPLVDDEHNARFLS